MMPHDESHLVGMDAVSGRRWLIATLYLLLNFMLLAIIQVLSRQPCLFYCLAMCCCKCTTVPIGSLAVKNLFIMQGY
jgi:hypothetical protein